MALGADARDVVRVVVRQALLLTVAGVIAGIAVSLAAARLLSSLLYGVTPGDPSTLASAAILLLAVSAVASYLPARRAVHVDPIEALRHD